MRSSIVTVEDFKKNTVHQYVKQKPENPDVRGFCTVELFNAETGEVEHRVVAENVYKDSQAQQAYSIALLNSGFISSDTNFVLGGALQEVHLLNDPSNTETTKTVIRGEGKFIGWANIQADYGGSDESQGNRNKQLSSSRIDPVTGELIYRMGWLFDQTRINDKPVNKIALTAYAFNGNEKKDTHFINPKLNGQTHRYDNNPRSSGDHSYTLDFDNSVFRDPYHNVNKNEFVRLHKMSGNYLTTVPVTYDVPGQNRFLLQLTDINELDPRGVVNHKYILDLGPISETLLYAYNCSYVMNCKTNMLYVTTYVNSTKKMHVFEYFIDPTAINKTPGISTVFVHSKATSFNLDIKYENPMITPLIDYKTGLVEIVHQTEDGITITRLDAALNEASTVLCSYAFLPMELSKIDDDNYFIIRDRGWTFSSPSETYSTMIGGFLQISTNRYVETLRLAPCWTNSNRNHRGINMLSNGSNNTSGPSFTFFDGRTGNVLQWIANSASVPGQVRWIMPVAHVPPSPYLFVDVIPEFTKTAAQSMKISYEIRVPMNLTKMSSPFDEYADFTNNSMLMPVSGYKEEFSPTVFMPWFQRPKQIFEPTEKNTAAISYGRNVKFSADKSVMIIGAISDTSNIGAIYVYRLVGTKYELEQKIAGVPGEFGFDLDINGAGTRIITGAPWESTSGYNYDGRVYMSTYDQVAKTWSPIGEAINWTGYVHKTYDFRGRTISVSKDGTTLVVGGCGDNIEAGNNNSSLPTVHVWDPATSLYVYKMKLESPTITFDNKTYPGYAIAVSNDGSTIVCGYPHDSSYGSKSGLIQVWVRSGVDVWSEQYIASPTTNTSAYFGCSLKLSGDGNTLVVGAYGEHTVYFYKRTGVNWLMTSKFTLEGLSQLGVSVSMSEDGTRAVASLRDGAYVTMYAQGAMLYRYNATRQVWEMVSFIQVPRRGYVTMSPDGNTVISHTVEGTWPKENGTGNITTRGQAELIDVTAAFNNITDLTPPYKIR